MSWIISAAMAITILRHVQKCVHWDIPAIQVGDQTSVALLEIASPQALRIVADSTDV
ncbi:hypothetical protein ABQZ69_12325 [Xanthomonas sp. WHRI 8391]|uniref:hypothetical protein n=1 Tax=Xanthomonas TaxID=338 RepID=UPI00178C65A4|nr:hypothetical protein [Xanthomonas hortorum]MBG3850508.1 hypothetical protein [Xanthomonas hortorum pv. carotae]UTS74452.1 hypothetical protein NMB96_06465 [Xanthomonas hortorum]